MLNGDKLMERFAHNAGSEDIDGLLSRLQLGHPREERQQASALLGILSFLTKSKASVQGGRPRLATFAGPAARSYSITQEQTPNPVPASGVSQIK